MNVDSLIVEVTRRCNMSCEHCLRGKAQNKDMTLETVRKFIMDNHIEYICSIVFTGGEPSLNTELIRQVLELFKTQSVGVGGFYIATNGRYHSESETFISVILEWALYTYDNIEDGLTSVEISNSTFHDVQRDRPADEQYMSKLMLLKFVKHRKPIDYKYLINQGNAVDYIYNSGVGNTCKRLKKSDYELSWDDDTLSGELYLNVDGDVIPCCDLSYKSQHRWKVGNIYMQTLKEMIPIQPTT